MTIEWGKKEVGGLINWSPKLEDGITSVVVTPYSATLAYAATMIFSALVSGTGVFDASVTWSLESGSGTLTQSGIFTSGSVDTTAVIRATSVENPDRWGEATVSVVGLNASVSFAGTEISPPTGSIAVRATSLASAVSFTGTEVSTPSGRVGAVAIDSAEQPEAQAILTARQCPPVRLLTDLPAIYAFDFRASMAAGETITAAQVTAASPGFENLDANPHLFPIGAPSINGRTVTHYLNGGVVNCRYLVRCVAVTSTGQRLYREITVRVLESWRTSTRFV